MRAAASADGVVSPERSTPLPAVAEVSDSEDGEGSEESAADPPAAEGGGGATPSHAALSSAAIAGAAATGAAGVASQLGYGSKAAQMDSPSSGAKPEAAAQGMQRAVPADHAGEDDALLKEASATAAAASSQQPVLPAVSGAAVPLAAPAAAVAAVGASAEGLSPLKAGPAATRQDDLEGLSPNSLAAGADFADLVTSCAPLFPPRPGPRHDGVDFPADCPRVALGIRTSAAVVVSSAVLARTWQPADIPPPVRQCGGITTVQPHSCAHADVT